MVDRRPASELWIPGWYESDGRAMFSFWDDGGEKPMMIVYFGEGPYVTVSPGTYEPVPMEVTEHAAQLAYAAERGGRLAIAYRRIDESI